MENLMQWFNDNMAIVLVVFGALGVLIPLFRKVIKEIKEAYLAGIDFGKYVIEATKDKQITDNEAEIIEHKAILFVKESTEAYSSVINLWTQIKKLLPNGKKK